MTKQQTSKPKQWRNRYTGGTYEIVNGKHPRGGLYLYMRETVTLAVITIHRGNLKSCFTPCNP